MGGFGFGVVFCMVLLRRLVNGGLDTRSMRNSFLHIRNM